VSSWFVFGFDEVIHVGSDVVVVVCCELVPVVLAGPAPDRSTSRSVNSVVSVRAAVPAAVPHPI
jgi:hypothetical protein